MNFFNVKLLLIYSDGLKFDFKIDINTYIIRKDIVNKTL